MKTEVMLKLRVEVLPSINLSNGRAFQGPCSGGLRVGRGHHVSSGLFESRSIFVASITPHSLYPYPHHDVRAPATLGRPRVANGPTCLPRATSGPILAVLPFPFYLFFFFFFFSAGHLTWSFAMKDIHGCEKC